MLLITPHQAQKKLAEAVRLRRLELQLTQQGLALRSGVALSTLRKFEQQGSISLAGFLKLQMALGTLGPFLQATQPQAVPFASMDEILQAKPKPPRQRGCKT